MKMEFLSIGAIFGTLLVLIGISMVIKAIFGIDIPIVRVAFAVFLVFVGIKILTGNVFEHREKRNAIFSEHEMMYDGDANDYNIIFGRGVVDLTNPDIIMKNGKTEVNTVFGEGIIKINPDVPTKVIVESVFAGANMPDGNTISFGEYTYTTRSYDSTKEYLEVRANVVFGSLKIVE